MAYYSLKPKVEVFIDTQSGGTIIRNTETGKNRPHTKKPDADIMAYFIRIPECADSEKIAKETNTSKESVEKVLNVSVVEGFIFEDEKCSLLD